MNIFKKYQFTPPENFNFPLAFGLDKCNNGCARFLVARRMAVGVFCRVAGPSAWCQRGFAITSVENVVGRLNRLMKGWGAFYSVGYPSKAFHAVNGYALRRMARFLNRKRQRRYRLKFADSYYGELNHYGMYWLRWADVRR